MMLSVIVVVASMVKSMLLLEGKYLTSKNDEVNCEFSMHVRSDVVPRWRDELLAALTGAIHNCSSATTNSMMRIGPISVGLMPKLGTAVCRYRSE